jgi:isopenicillin-N N-acyltransferase-like protein
MCALPVPLVELRGTPAEIGAAHGELLRDLVREHAERNLEWILSASALRLDEAGLWRLWAPVVTANEAEAPELVEEMRGIARGSGVSFEHIFLLNSLLDVSNLRWPESLGSLVGCTTFALPNDPETGRAFIGQTYDLAAFRQRFNVLLKISPSEGPQQLVYSMAGMIGAAGLNEDGMGIVINYLSANDCRPGKLHAVIVRKALAGRNLADAVTAPTTGKRAGGSHYLISDAEGYLVSVETTATKFALAYADGKPFGHTNHYLTGRLEDSHTIRPSALGSSIARYTTLRRLLQQEPVTEATLHEIAGCHVSYPRSICAHGSPSEPADLRGLTVASVIMSLSERTMQYCDGCPCSSEFEKVEL